MTRMPIAEIDVVYLIASVQKLRNLKFRVIPFVFQKCLKNSVQKVLILIPLTVFITELHS